MAVVEVVEEVVVAELAAPLRHSKIPCLVEI